MTSLLALAGTPFALDDALVRRVLLRGRPNDEPHTITILRPAHDTAATLALATPPEAPASIAHDARWWVVAHAAVYYRDDLARAMHEAGAAPPARSSSDAEWILAVLNVWGKAGVDRLEGEFAFVAYDAVAHELVAARDHTGGRTLFHTALGRGIAVATSLRALRELPTVSPALNLVALAEDVGDMDLAVVTETAYSAIARVPAGHVLHWAPWFGTTVRRWWEIPVFQRPSELPFDEAAHELHHILSRAVRERTALPGTAVMLSGGYDSTAIYGAGQAALVAEGAGAQLGAVSLSHPDGDPGREDELILATTHRYGREPHWIVAGDIPTVGDPFARAAQRDEPLGHFYELWNQALAEGVRAAGARVAMNGNGGDPWFSVSPLFLADLFRRGEWGAFRHEYRALVGRFRIRRLVSEVVRPNLPPWLAGVIEGARGGRALPDRFARPIPAWIAEPLRRDPALVGRRRHRPPRRAGEGLSAAEQAWFLYASFPERINALVFSICQRAGVELRTPLLDSRLVRFAATRPRVEMNREGENKRLLRRAVEGVLPQEVTGRRERRTGLPVSYFRRALEAHLRRAQQDVARGMILADVGVVDHRLFVRALAQQLAGEGADDEQGAALIAAWHGEWWLRANG